jgi:hypothetical protein
MQILNSAVAILSPGEIVQAVLAGAPSTTQPTWSSWWQDAQNPLANHSVGAMSGSSPVTLVPDPSGAGSRVRVVQSARVFNADTSDVTVTISKTTSAGNFTLAKVTLQAGDHLIFDERGLIVLNSYGQAESISG